MKKRYIMSAIGALSASAVVAYVLSDEEKRAKLLDVVETVKEKIDVFNEVDEVSTLDAAGIPDQTSYSNDTLTENADMVSEGSQYGVAYFNKKMEEENTDNPQW